eukprot:TRINITY_DN3949_c0_g1_i1.p1 TRINITY_DN3949_c0_g1~~TRINITY_DN3949_c0_g1_i1.p1  ORF type:complete len:209 (+),score=42.21 TRINITY_DN3949_c0_g1_i1:167-793(+)
MSKMKGSILGQQAPQVKSSLVELAAELTSFQQELEQRNQDKEELFRLLNQLKKEIAVIKSKSQKIRLRNEKLSNQTFELVNKGAAARSESLPLQAEIRQTKKEMIELDKAREQYQHETAAIQDAIRYERTCVIEMHNVIDRAQQELQLQLKERERYKAEATASAKHQAGLSAKVQEWTNTNESFMANINPKRLSTSMSASMSKVNYQL